MSKKHGKTNQKLAHEMMAATAKEMAGCWYEEAAHDNDFYHFYPSQKMFVNREWPRFIDAAKTQLTLMLGNPNVPEHQKEQIFEAIVRHASLPGNIDPRVAKKLIDNGDQPIIPMRMN